ncbi:phenylalanine--tRNA ligase subunit alpha [bacterium]|nr:MAG: phenylalanine--tRNA ligase subunit alpha [bacterium]
MSETTELQNKVSLIDTISELDTFEKDTIGPQSELMKKFKDLTQLPVEQRKLLGNELNNQKKLLQNIFDTKREELKKKELSIQLSTWKDISLAIPQHKIGKLNPLTQERWKIEDIFQKMGFEIAYAFEVDSEYNNFEAVNIPEGHPARDSWDTLFTNVDKNVLITHTSSLQNRILKEFATKIDALENGFLGTAGIGKCFRHESTDARHEHTFFQCEGVVVGKGIRFSDMIGILKTFFEAYFEKEVEIRISCDYFPFVEPGNGIEIRWDNPSENILKITKGTGWLEVLGCGMIHPNVLKMAEIDHEVYSGFAWGFGLERLVMIKYAVDDIRLFHSGDRRFLDQF